MTDKDRRGERSERKEGARRGKSASREGLERSIGQRSRRARSGQVVASVPDQYFHRSSGGTSGSSLFSPPFSSDSYPSCFRDVIVLSTLSTPSSVSFSPPYRAFFVSFALFFPSLPYVLSVLSHAPLPNGFRSLLLLPP